MKKSQRKTLLSIMLCIGLVLSISGTASATSSSEYAWSVGVNHTSNDEYTGDFTPNVYYSATCYGMISGIEAFYSTNPSISLLKASSPNGVRKLAGRLVFLTGHASPTLMDFGQSKACGVTSGYDYSASWGYDYAGLKSIGDMSTVDLISFFGCSTAGATENFASVSVSLGANSAIGFTNPIVSRSGEGALWTRRLHDYLATGKTLQQAITYATADAPGSSTAAYVKAYGDLNNLITDTQSTSSLVSMDSSVFEISTDITPERVNIPMGDLDNCIFSSVSNGESDEMTQIANKIKEINPAFDLSDYRITVNMFSENGNSGVILFTYFIGDNIVTNRAYAVSIVDGVAEEIVPSYILRDSFTALAVDTESLETELISIVEQFDAQLDCDSVALPAYVDDGGFVESPSDILSESYNQYFYDFATGELTYTETQFYLTGGNNSVYADVSRTWELN